MTMKQKKAAASRDTFCGDSFHLSAAAMAGVGQGSEPPFSPSRDAEPDDVSGRIVRRGSLTFCFSGAGSIDIDKRSSSMAEMVVVGDMLRNLLETRLYNC